MALYSMPKNSRRSFLKLAKEDLSSLDEISDVAGKIEKLVSLFEITPEQHETRRSECAELRELLRKYYPDCMLLPFGTTVNGFGLKYSDLDLLFLPFPGYCNIDFAPKEKESMEKESMEKETKEKETKEKQIKEKQIKEKSSPDPAAVLSGEISKDVLTKLDELAHLLFIKKIFKKEKKLVQKQYVIPAKHSPTLRAHFTNSKIACDLAASNRLVVYNSELLQLFGKLDPRVKPLVITLRLWANSVGLLTKKYFSTYSFTLLVIFFLQNTNPPVLVPVRRLIEMSGFNRMIAGWQTAFTDVPPPKTKNTETLEDLLTHFFLFYWNFDFSQHIISPYHGKVLPIKDLKNNQDKRLAEFSVASVNIQDPFILSRNCCKIGGYYGVLKLALFVAYQIMQDKSGKFNFCMLFNVNVYDTILNLHFEKYVFGKERVFAIALDYDCHTAISKNMENSPSWFERAAQAVFDVLQYGLLMDCEVTDQMLWAGHDIKNEMETNGAPIICLTETSKVKNSPFDLELLISLQCVVYTRVWIGRKQLMEVKQEDQEYQDEFEEFSHPVLKAEYNLSKALIKKNPAIDSPQPLLCFKCECFKHSSPQISDVIVILKPLTASKEFHAVSIFLKSFLMKTVKKIISSA